MKKDNLLKLKVRSNMRQAFRLITGSKWRLDLGDFVINKTPEEVEAIFEGDGILTLGAVTAPKEVWRDAWAIVKQEDVTTSEPTDEDIDALDATEVDEFFGDV